MAHPLHHTSNQWANAGPQAESAVYTDDEHDAYLAYQYRFQAHTTSSLLQSALETEAIRESQFLEGRDWQEQSSGMLYPIRPSDTSVLGSLVGLFRKNDSEFVTIQKDLDHLQQTSNRILAHMSAPRPDFQSSSPTHDSADASPFQHNRDHDAYAFYSDFAQTHMTDHLFQAALESEAIREAQVLEGRERQEGVSGGVEDQPLRSDTGVLGALVNLYGHSSGTKKKPR